MITRLTEIIRTWLIQLGVSESGARYISGVTDFLLVIILGIILYYIAKFIIVRVIRRIALRTRSKWDDALLEKKVFNRLAFLIPGILVYQSVPATLNEFSPESIQMVLKFTNIYIILVFLLVINSFFNAIYEVYQKTDYAMYHPIKGYIQVGKIVMFIIGSLLILSYLFNQSPLYMIGGLGAFSAVLLLVFKDPILGFVGGIQLSANDMVRQGDWISMPKFAADGTVIENIPHYGEGAEFRQYHHYLADLLPGFRVVPELPGHDRIGCTADQTIHQHRYVQCEILHRRDADKFRKISLIKDYIDETQAELEKYNKENAIDNSIPVNGRRQTNIGIFRAYLQAYLASHPMIHNESDQLVRQLQPSSTGIPIEVYAFIEETGFVKFEKIQADIFDHILAIIPEFELRVFQSPTGEDLRQSNMAYWERNDEPLPL
jgi:miniconductance mechanosensitive channel